MKALYKHYFQRRHRQLDQQTHIQQIFSHTLNTVVISITGGSVPVSINPLRG